MSSGSFENILESIESLSFEKQDCLLALIIKRRIAKRQNKIALDNPELKPKQKVGNFWDALQNFRAKLERESIVFNDDDFANLRDKSPGRKVEFSGSISSKSKYFFDSKPLCFPCCFLPVACCLKACLLLIVLKIEMHPNLVNFIMGANIEQNKKRLF
ncbi:MAG: hypothetical protein SXA11_13855 [Cyanobacteriota bacterium]|nr:hypothetical protein [Cyanobacteriota bacterium]